MSMKGYEQKVPEKVREENQAKLAAYEAELEANKKSMADLASLM